MDSSADKLIKSAIDGSVYYFFLIPKVISEVKLYLRKNL